MFLASLGYIFYLKFSKKYTRERFAFYGVTVMVTLISSFITQVYSSQGFITAVINTSNFVLHTNITSYQTDFKDHLITFFVLSLFMRFILNLHKNWNGPISETLFNKKRFHENPTILAESYLQLKDFLSKEKIIQPHVENEKAKHFNIFVPSEDDKTPWHESVYELLTFSSLQYKIDLQNDYYQEEKIFISRFGHNNKPIAIFCCIDLPKDSAIRNFILFCRKQKLDFTKLIVAVKNEISESKTINWRDTDLQFRYENEMLNSLVDFSSYKHYIKDQFTSKEITLGTGIKLHDIYVELKGKTDKEVSIPALEAYIYEWLEAKDDNRHLAILGEYGCGKSVLSLKITYELLENRTANSRIPILIELRGKSPRNLSVTEIISTWASNFRLDPASILKLHRAGKLLVIFEGFDEMDMIGDREMRLNHFQRLWEFAMPRSKIIITGRPNFFLDDKELKTNLGIEKPYEASHYCEAIHLEKFTSDQIKHALRNIDRNTGEQILDILEKSNNSNFYDLVSRPAILYLIGVIWKERKLSEIKDNINSAVVISEFIKYTYSRQNDKKILFPLSEKEREYFMLGVAVGMWWTNEYSNQISKDDLESIILKLYRGFPDEITPTQNATQPKRKLLKERMIDNSQAEETILTDVRSCGILVNDLTRKDHFKFAHKSFLEYQISYYFVESILQDKGEYNIMVNAISNALGTNSPELRHSKETIFFTAEILIGNLKLGMSNDPRNICKQLFSLLHPNKVLGKHPKLSAFLEMYWASLSLIVLFSPVFLMPFMRESFGMMQFAYVLLLISVAMTFFIIITKYILPLSGGRISVKRASIWLKCCNQLNIPESIISEIVPSKYILHISGKYQDPLLKVMNRLSRLLTGIEQKEER